MSCGTSKGLSSISSAECMRRVLVFESSGHRILICMLASLLGTVSESLEASVKKRGVTISMMGVRNDDFAASN